MANDKPTPLGGNTDADNPGIIRTDAGTKTIAEAAGKTPAAGRQTTRSRRKASVDEGPRYRVTKLSQIDNALCGPGTDRPEVTYFGLPGSGLVPINAEAKKRKDAVRKIRTGDGTDAEKQTKLTALSDDWNGVEKEDEFADADEE